MLLSAAAGNAVTATTRSRAPANHFPRKDLIKVPLFFVGAFFNTTVSVKNIIGLCKKSRACNKNIAKKIQWKCKKWQNNTFLAKKIEFINVDFPTFVLPIIETKPDLNFLFSFKDYITGNNVIENLFFDIFYIKKDFNVDLIKLQESEVQDYKIVDIKYIKELFKDKILLENVETRSLIKILEEKICANNWF